jgi:phosphohistidine phosphatase
MASSMEVFLVRHAIAHERNRKRWPDDALRPLTPAGARKFRKAAKGLATLLPKRAALLTSPWVRARDTATMLARATGRAKPVECAQLTGDAAVDDFFDLLRARKGKAVILVGHEPNLSAFLSAALGKRARLQFEFKKGGAACVKFGRRITPGSATFKWMAPPRMLRELAG